MSSKANLMRIVWSILTVVILLAEGGTDDLHNLVYINADGGPYYGVALLGSDPALNITLINNPEYIYPGFQVYDQDKIDHLNGTLKVGSHQPKQTLALGACLRMPSVAALAVMMLALSRACSWSLSTYSGSPM